MKLEEEGDGIGAVLTLRKKKKKIDSFKNLPASDSVWLEMRGTHQQKMSLEKSG